MKSFFVSLVLLVIALTTVLVLDGPQLYRELFGPMSCPHYNFEHYAHACDDDIREAFFRDQMHGNASHVFLLINGKDPSSTFMQRFQDLSPSPKMASQSTRGEFLQVFDAETKKPGVVLVADGIKRLKDGSVEVDGGWQSAGLCGGGYTYKMVFSNGKWRVTHFLNP